MSTKTVWITGASSGIGREFARRYARLGFRLILTARRRDRLEALAAELLAKHGTLCRIVPADLEQDAQVAALCEALADERIDLFLNNAACAACVSCKTGRGQGAFHAAGKRAGHAPAVQVHPAQDGSPGLWHHPERGILGGPAAGRALYGGLLCLQGTSGSHGPRVRELREQHSPVYVCALCPGPVDTEFNDRADVVFALKGITPELCVEEAMRGMLHRKTIIVPSTLMRLSTTAQKLVPTPLLMPILAHQQKKKAGADGRLTEHRRSCILEVSEKTGGMFHENCTHQRKQSGRQERHH